MSTDDVMRKITYITRSAVKGEVFCRALDNAFRQSHGSAARALKLFTNLGVEIQDASVDICESAKEVCKDVKPL